MLKPLEKKIRQRFCEDILQSLKTSNLRMTFTDWGSFAIGRKDTALFRWHCESQDPDVFKDDPMSDHPGRWESFSIQQPESMEKICNHLKKFVNNSNF